MPKCHGVAVIASTGCSISLTNVLRSCFLQAKGLSVLHSNRFCPGLRFHRQTLKRLPFLKPQGKCLEGWTRGWGSGVQVCQLRPGLVQNVAPASQRWCLTLTCLGRASGSSQVRPLQPPFPLVRALRQDDLLRVCLLRFACRPPPFSTTTAMREAISIHLGQAGVQVRSCYGSAWGLVLSERFVVASAFGALSLLYTTEAKPELPEGLQGRSPCLNLT
jgi:hypothetical protein